MAAPAVIQIPQTRPANPRTSKQPARATSPAELLRKIETRIRSLEVIAKRSDDRDNVFADLRAGIPVIVMRSFKWEGEYPTKFAEWHPGYEFIPRLAEVMEQPGYKGIVITKAHYQAGNENNELKKIAAELSPLVANASGYKYQAATERAAQEQARLQVIAHKAAAEQAETNAAAAEKELTAYVSKLDFEI